MLNRWKKLLKESERQLERAEAARAAAKPVWAYYAAHQSAETAIKALRLKHSLNGRERMVARLLLDLPAGVTVPDALFEKAAIFDSHYLPVHLDKDQRELPRLNGKVTSEHAVQTATEILAFVKAELNGNGKANGHASGNGNPQQS